MAGEKVSNILHVTDRRRKVSNISHMNIFCWLTATIRQAGVSTDAKASRRFWYRKYFKYLEDIGYPKGRCIQRLELQVASGFRDAARYSPYIHYYWNTTSMCLSYSLARVSPLNCSFFIAQLIRVKLTR